MAPPVDLDQITAQVLPNDIDRHKRNARLSKQIGIIL